MAATDIDKLAIYHRPSGTLLPLVSPTTQIGANSTTSVTAVAIGFTFTFDGDSGDTLSELTPFGALAFVGTGLVSPTINLFAVSTFELVAPFYGAQKTAITTGYVKTETQGTAPFRRFVVEWKTYAADTHTGTDNDTLTFQAVLYETISKIEFRFGARVTTGTPGALGQLGLGIKGNTISASDNYRDVAVDDLELGGSKTTTTTNLDMTDYDALVGTVVVLEPNWPMSGRAVIIDPNELNGFDPYSLVFWKIANFVNWLWCKHTPALLNFAPWQQTAVLSETFVRPVVPSDEGASYDVYVQVYTSNNTNCTVSIDEDDATDPQPATGADWSNLVANVQAVTTAAWNELAVFTITIDPSTTYLRFVVSVAAGTVIVGSVLVRPTPLADVDETYTSSIGFVPMALQQMRQDGSGAVHPEWLNRAYRNMAYILGDRRQEVWSSVWPSSEKLTGTTPKPVRTIGVAKANLGWLGQTAKARIYARDTTGDAAITLSEQGNALLEEFVVAASGGEFRKQTADIDLLSSEPLITATCNPVGDLYPMSVAIDWAPTLSGDDLIVGVTPAPKLAYLDAIAARMELALRCYAHTGQATMLARGKTSSNKWRVQTMVGPAVKALRPKVTRDSDDHTATSLDTLIYAASSGSGASDEIAIPSPNPRGRDDYPPEGTIAVAAGAEVYDAAPGASMDRYLESPTATSMTGAVRERVEVVRGVGITFVAVPADPLAL